MSAFKLGLTITVMLAFWSSAADADEKVPAQRMGEVAGSYIAGGLVGAATTAVAKKPIAGAISGVATVKADKVGSRIGGAYGKSIDKLGYNPFYPTPFARPRQNKNRQN